MASGALAVMVSLGVPGVSSAADASPPPSPSAPQVLSKTQWKQIDTVADKHAALGVFGASDPVLALPAGTTPAQRSAAETALPAGADIDTRISQFTKDQLTKVEGKIMERKWSADAGKYGVSVQYDAQKDRILVGTDAPSSVTKPLLDAYPGRVEVRGSRLEPASNRFNDWQPFYGGAALVGGNTGLCTSGFAVKFPNSSNSYMVTAAHCFGFWQNIYNKRWNGTAGAEVGKVAFRFADIDTELIGDKGYSAHIYTGGTPDSESKMFVHGTQQARNGLQVCMSGARTYNHCGHPISNTSFSVCYGGTDACIKNGQGFVAERGGTNWPRYDNGTVGIPGDSGSPFYTHDSTGSAAWIVGMMSGTQWDCCGHPVAMVGVKIGPIMSVTGTEPILM